MNLIDSHCHLDATAFDTDRIDVLARCRASGIEAIVVPGVRRPDFPTLKAVCASSPMLHAAYGLHPLFLAHHRPEDIDALRDWLAREKPVAVGEIGLDWHTGDEGREHQQALFEKQLALAREFDLPVILHVRGAHDTVLSTLRRFRLPRGGICHAYSGSLEQARQYIGLGFLLGFGGAAVSSRASRLHRLLRELPRSTLALETDAPDMPPAFLARGTRNSPEYLPRITEILTGHAGCTADELARVTSDNVSRLLRLPAPGR